MTTREMHRQLLRKYGVFQWARYVLVAAMVPVLRLIPGIYNVDGFVIRFDKRQKS